MTIKAANSDEVGIKLLQLSKPHLYIAKDPANPELPPLPTSHLVLPDVGLNAYYGEDFSLLLVATRNTNTYFENHELFKISAHLRSSAGYTQTFPLSIHNLSATHHSASRILQFTPDFPGKYLLNIEVLHEFQLEIKRTIETYEFEVKPAVSIRFKVSRGSSGIKAKVLEAQIENLTNSALMIEGCELMPQNGWAVESLEEEPGRITLRPSEVYQYSFMLRGSESPEAGPLVIRWRREPLGVKGKQTTAPVRV